MRQWQKPKELSSKSQTKAWSTLAVSVSFETMILKFFKTIYKSNILQHAYLSNYKTYTQRMLDLKRGDTNP